MSAPTGIAFGRDGKLYVADEIQRRVYRYDGNSDAFLDIFITFASVGFNEPRDLEFSPDGDLYLSSGTGRIRHYDGQTGEFLGLLDPQNTAGVSYSRFLTITDVPEASSFVLLTGTLLLAFRRRGIRLLQRRGRRAVGTVAAGRHVPRVNDSLRS